MADDCGDKKRRLTAREQEAMRDSLRVLQVDGGKIARAAGLSDPVERRKALGHLLTNLDANELRARQKMSLALGRSEWAEAAKQRLDQQLVGFRREIEGAFRQGSSPQPEQPASEGRQFPDSYAGPAPPGSPRKNGRVSFRKLTAAERKKRGLPPA